MNAWALQGEVRDLVHWVAEALYGTPKKADDRLANKRRAVQVVKRMCPKGTPDFRMVELVYDEGILLLLRDTLRGMKRVLASDPNAYAVTARAVQI